MIVTGEKPGASKPGHFDRQVVQREAKTMKWLPSIESTLVRQLIIPMIAVILICAGINVYWSAGGFFINLATELIGIVVTVFIVDRVINEHDERKWGPSQARAKASLMTYANSLVTCIRSGLKVGVDVFPQWMLYSDDVVKNHKEIMNVAINTISPRVEGIIDSLDVTELRDFEAHLRQAMLLSDKLFSRHHSQFTAKQLPILHDIETSIERFSFGLTVFPEVIGTVDEVSANRFLPISQQNLDLRSAAVADMAKVVRDILSFAAKLSETLGWGDGGGRGPVER